MDVLSSEHPNRKDHETVTDQPERTDISNMTDSEKAAMYEQNRQDMIDRQPTADDSAPKS